MAASQAGCDAPGATHWPGSSMRACTDIPEVVRTPAHMCLVVKLPMPTMMLLVHQAEGCLVLVHPFVYWEAVANMSKRFT
jgi:hypothetical protein